MAQATSIEWTDDTWNPVRGCTRVSAGCDNCYAMNFAHRWNKVQGHAFEGLTVIRQGKVDWNGTIRLVEDKLLEPFHMRKPRKIFVNSMSDLFHHNVPDEYIDKVFAVMALCPPHTFQILTKRPDRMLGYLSDRERKNKVWQTAVVNALRFGFKNADDLKKDFSWPLPNVWLGVSVEDQTTADERIPLLLQTPAAVRFISAEPLLVALSLNKMYEHYIGGDMSNPGYLNAFNGYAWHPQTCIDEAPDRASSDGIHWVIVGGESGPGARPFNVEWARDIVKQCKAADVPVFIKQLGADPIETHRGQIYEGVLIGKNPASLQRLKDRKGGDISEWPEDLRVRQFPKEVGV